MCYPLLQGVIAFEKAQNYGTKEEKQSRFHTVSPVKHTSFIPQYFTVNAEHEKQAAIK